MYIKLDFLDSILHCFKLLSNFILWQGSVQVDPRILIGSSLIRILTHGLFNLWKLP